jgi:hypothetical protein
MTSILLTDVTPLAKENSIHLFPAYQDSYNSHFTLLTQDASHSAVFATSVTVVIGVKKLRWGE